MKTYSIEDSRRYLPLGFWENQLVIYLLEAPRKPSQLYAFRDPRLARKFKSNPTKLSRYLSQYFTRGDTGYINRLKQLGFVTGEGDKWRRYTIYDIDFSLLTGHLLMTDLTLLKQERYIHNWLTDSDSKRRMLNLTEFIKENRALLFKMDNFRSLFYNQDGGWRLPYFSSFINLSLSAYLMAAYEIKHRSLDRTNPLLGDLVQNLYSLISVPYGMDGIEKLYEISNGMKESIRKSKDIEANASLIGGLFNSLTAITGSLQLPPELAVTRATREPIPLQHSEPHGEHSGLHSFLSEGIPIPIPIKKFEELKEEKFDESIRVRQKFKIYRAKLKYIAQPAFYLMQFVRLFTYEGK